MDVSKVTAADQTRSINWDLLEKIVVTLLLGTLATRMIPAAVESEAWQNWIILLAEGCVAFFVLIRRPTTVITRRPRDWVLGFGGTFAAMLAVPSSDVPLVPLQICLFLMLAGLFIQLYAKFVLRRSFGVVAANRGVKIGGPYRFVRHPMYAGYALTHIGFLLSGPTVWNFAVYALALGLNIARLVAEERVLMDDPAYREMAARVRYRLFPGIF
jgi:protein-S-isoprenylcysteine O-methyltransferase Ste14